MIVHAIPLYILMQSLYASITHWQRLLFVTEYYKSNLTT